MAMVGNIGELWGAADDSDDGGTGADRRHRDALTCRATAEIAQGQIRNPRS
jgi:hypothetical protein